MKLAAYELLDLVASGGFGEVWRATRSDLDGLFAVKMIHRRLLADPRLVRRFQLEIAMCSSLEHDNVVPIVDHGTANDGTPYYVMPLITGQTLREQLRTTGALDVREAGRIFGAVCNAVETAHQAGIIHRDIKSSNVLMDADSKPRVCDFGLAKLLAEDGPNLTRSREVLGTPACMAPEQANGGRVDHRADIYALGVLLYELVAGSLPFGNSSMTVLAQLHGYAKRPRLPDRADIPQTLNSIIGKAMHIDVDKRYDSAAQLRDAVSASLEKAISDELEPSWLLFLEDRQESIEDSEDLLDAFEEELCPEGGGVLFRASRRMILALRCAEVDEGLLVARSQELIGERRALSAHRLVKLLWQGAVPARMPQDLRWPEALQGEIDGPSSQMRTLRLR